ncbi:MAG TPA: hypothetical protein VH744_14795, partial [Terriglobales bacterium]
MASPTALPPVQQRPPRSLAGPVVLIASGIVLLLSTLRVLQWHALMLWFGRFWPLLLILWGVIKLAEYYQAQRSGTRSPGIGVGGVFLVIFLVLFGITVTGVSRFNWGAIRDEINIDNNDFPFFGHNYTYEDEVAQDFPAGATLRIETARGALNVNSADDQ